MTSGSEVGLELDPATGKVSPSPRNANQQLMSRYVHQQVIEVYGFVGWIATFFAWVAYLLWAFLPEQVLHQARKRNVLSMSRQIYGYPGWSNVLP
jgi:hypothetical protein